MYASSDGPSVTLLAGQATHCMEEKSKRLITLAGFPTASEKGGISRSNQGAGANHTAVPDANIANHL